jgi:hypothetical protein
MEASRQLQASAALLSRKGQSLRSECSIRLEEVFDQDYNHNLFLAVSALTAKNRNVRV